MWAAGDLNSGPHACQQALELLSQSLNPIYIVFNFKRRKGNSQSTSEGLYLKEEPGPVWAVRRNGDDISLQQDILGKAF